MTEAPADYRKTLISHKIRILRIKTFRKILLALAEAPYCNWTKKQASNVSLKVQLSVEALDSCTVSTVIISSTKVNKPDSTKS